MALNYPLRLILTLSPLAALQSISLICKPFLMADRLRLTFTTHQITFSGENMTFTMLSTQSVTVIGKPVLADGTTTSTATLSGVSYHSADSSIFTVTPDPATPNGAIIKGIAAGTATLTETATATEADGSITETITGTATIVLTEVVSPASSLVFTFGVPA